MLVQIFIFIALCAKKQKKPQKVKNLQQNLAKKWVFKFAPKRWSGVLFPIFSYLQVNFKLLFTSHDAIA